MEEKELEFLYKVGISFSEWYNKNIKRIRYLLRDITNDDYIEDTIQESMIKVLNNINQFDNTKASIDTWAFTIILNHQKHIYKKESKMDKTPIYDIDYDIEDITDNVYGDYVLMLKLINDLPEDLKYLIVEKYVKKRKTQDISDELGINISTLKNKLTKGKNLLVKKYKKHK